jgi:hypothetical protein
LSEEREREREEKRNCTKSFATLHHHQLKTAVRKKPDTQILHPSPPVMILFLPRGSLSTWNIEATHLFLSSGLFENYCRKLETLNACLGGEKQLEASILSLSRCLPFPLPISSNT